MTRSATAIRSVEAVTATEVLNRIVEADLGCVYERLVLKGYLKARDIKRLDPEFKKFFALACTSAKPLAVISPLIDEVWHQFILFTEKYLSFCNENAGFFVHHRPDTLFTPVPQSAGENFLIVYEHNFGPLPSIWWKGMSPELIYHYQTRPILGPPAARWSGWVGRPDRPRPDV